MKLVYMADGLFLYKSCDGYVVLDQNDNILKLSKTCQSCSKYILKTLQTRRAAENETINQNKNQHSTI